MDVPESKIKRSDSMKKIIISLIFVIMIFTCNSVFAVAEVIYNENMYTAIVKNPDGATVYHNNPDGSEVIEKRKTVSSGTLISVEGSIEKNGEKYVIFNKLDANDNWEFDTILESDIEQYNKLVLPEELRIRKRKCESKICLFG